MISEYKYLDKKTYDIIENADVLAVNPRIADIISILNKKGYHTINGDIYSIGLTISYIDLLNEIISNNIISNVNENKAIAEIIDRFGSISLYVIFDKEYDFVLPIGFNKANNDIFYNISPIKMKQETVQVKSIEELEQEIGEKLNILKEWANSLSELNNALESRV